MKHVPSIAILSIDVAAKLNEEFNNVEVAGANGVVQGGDAFIVGSTGVGNLCAYCANTICRVRSQYLTFL